MANHSVSREPSVNPILFYHLTDRYRKRTREELNGFGTKRNSRSYRFALDLLTAITFLIAFGVLSHAWRTFQRFFVRVNRRWKSWETLAGCRSYKTFARRSSRICSSVFWDRERISFLRRSFEFPHASNKSSSPVMLISLYYSFFNHYDFVFLLFYYFIILLLFLSKLYRKLISRILHVFWTTQYIKLEKCNTDCIICIITGI